MGLVINDTSVLGKNCEAIKPSYSRIGWNNKATLFVASDSAAGFPASNLLESTTYQKWTSTSNNPVLTATVSGSISFVGIAAHNLKNAGSVKAEYFNGAWNDIGIAYPDSGEAIAFLFDEVAATQVRFTFDCDKPVSIAIMLIGDTLVIPADLDKGFIPPKLMSDTVFSNNRTNGGQNVGSRVVRTIRPTQAKWSLTTLSWWRDTFIHFVEYTETVDNSFFLIPNPKFQPDDVYFVMLNENIRPDMGSRNAQFLPTKITGECYFNAD